MFCSYCGAQIAIDNGETVNTQNINIHERYTNDADIEREKNVYVRQLESEPSIY